MTREKFPEKIPFRLTRMLTNAMEVSACLQLQFAFALNSSSFLNILKTKSERGFLSLCVKRE